MQRGSRPDALDRMPLPAAVAAGMSVRLPASQVQNRATWLMLVAGLGIVVFVFAGGRLPARTDFYWIVGTPAAFMALVLFGVQAKYRTHRLRGFVLAVEPRGLHFEDLPLIPWSAIRTAEAGDIHPLGATRSRPHLVLALERPCYDAVRAAFPWSTLWYSGRNDDASATTFLSIDCLDQTPAEVLEMVDAGLRRYRATKLHGDAVEASI